MITVRYEIHLFVDGEWKGFKGLTFDNEDDATVVLNALGDSTDGRWRLVQITMEVLCDFSTLSA